MKSFSSMCLLINTVLLACICIQINLVNGQTWHGDRMLKLLIRFEPSSEENLNTIQEKPMKEVDINNFKSKFRNHGKYNPFFTYRPNFFPFSYYGKGHGDVLHTVKSNYYVKKNSQDDRIQYEKRSVSSAVVRGNLNEYETLLNALNSLQTEKDVDVSSLITNYDNGLKQVLEHLLPQLSADKIDNIKKLLNSMIKRRFGSWGGRKRSEFYSWGGRKKRNEESERNGGENKNPVNYLNDMGRTKTKKNDKERMVNNGLSDATTAKRENDFYPWGGKRTVQPNFALI